MGTYDAIRHLCYEDHSRSEFRRIGRLIGEKPFPTPVDIVTTGIPDMPWELVLSVIDTSHGMPMEKDVVVEPGQLVVWHGGVIHILWQKADGSAGLDTYRYPSIESVDTRGRL